VPGDSERKKLRVILNDRVLFLPLTGVGSYVAQLQAALAALHEADNPRAPSVSVHPFMTKLVGPPRQSAPRRPPGATARALPATSGRRRPWWLRRILQDAYGVAFRMRAGGFDLYHEPNHVPIACRTPTITTIHDVSVLVHPEWHPDDRVRWYERGFARGCAQSVRFITVSDFTRREMTRALGIAPERIDVTPLAPRATLTPPPAEQIARVRSEYALPERFFLFVGTLEPRKNVAGLLEAFAGLPAGVRRTQPLVLAGGVGWKIETLDTLIERLGIRDQLHPIDYVDDDVLAVLYATATALVWPTLYEGFGLPPLEAMQCGCPVIVSDVASLPEVVGDAGVLLPPGEVSAWTAAMAQMSEDAAWRADWIRRGRARAATFSWGRCAAQTVAAYHAAVQSL
jgi:glycosyltransferase involved in cell wall biosynthesis